MSAMNNGVSEGTPWLPMIDNHCRTATILEGAEVVRTAAVSYATPIIHQVYIKGSPSPFRLTFPGVQNKPGNTIMNHNTTTVSSKDANKISSVGPGTILSSQFKLGNSDMHLGLSEKIDIRYERQATEANHPPSSSTAKLTSSSSLAKSSMQCSESLSASQLLRSPFAPSSLSSDSKICPLSSPQPLIYTNVSSSMNVPQPTASPSSESSSSSSLSPSLPSTRPDDELTSLSWLQDSNLLRGTALTPIKSAKAAADAAEAAAAAGSSTSSVDRKRQRPNRRDRMDAAEVSSFSRGSESSTRADLEDERKADSPPSNYGDEPSDASSDPPESNHKVSKQTVPYNPKVHTMAKPPFSFSCLIFMAIEESSTKALPVKDIYTWIIDHYPYYKNAPTGWKNSVRHNLSLNKCFAKVEKAPSLGKGSLWMVDQNHRPNLLQAMSKAPFTTISPLDRTYTLSSKAVNNSECQLNVAIKSEDVDGITTMRDSIHTTEDGSSQNIVQRSCSPSDRKSPGSPKLRIPTRQYHRNTAHDANNVSKSKNNNSTNNNNHNHISNNNIFTPNPELFPLLAKRLELKALYESQLYDGSSDIDVQIEDVDAAAAMMVLKHGPRMLTPLSETYIQLRKQHFSLLDSLRPVGGKKRKDSMTDPDVDSSNKMFISSSPSIDHSYITQTGNGVYKSSSGSFPENGQSLGTNESSSKKDSPPSFDDEDNERTWMRENRYIHRPLEEANALLNLASIATSLASRRDEVDCESSEGLPYFAESHSAPIESQLESRMKSLTKNNNTVNKRSSSTKKVGKRHSASTNGGVNSRVLSKHFKSKDRTLSLDLDREQSAKVATVAKSRSSVSHSHYNNNLSDVLNRNKVLKHKKLRLRRHKVC